MVNKRRLGFRSWFYFRVGWATYFAFIFAAINTLTVTYYLAIERVSSLKIVFPTFTHYVLILAIIGIPFLILIGWIHYRKTAAYESEAEVQVESNPYYYKAAPGWQKEVMFPVLEKILEITVKNSKNEKLADDDLEEISILQKKLDSLIKGEMIGSPRLLSERSERVS